MGSGNPESTCLGSLHFANVHCSKLIESRLSVVRPVFENTKHPLIWIMLSFQTNN